MESKEVRAILEGPITKTLIVLAFPTSWGLALLTIVGALDVYYLSMVGPDALGAVGFVLPWIMIFINISMGLTNGFSVLVAELLGMKQSVQAKMLLVRTILLMLCINILVVVAGLIFGEFIFSKMGATGHVLELSLQFWHVSLYGIPLAGILFIFNALLRAVGESFVAGAVLSISALTIWLFDYLLVLGNAGFPALGVRGAAFATVAGWFAANIVAGTFLIRHSYFLIPKGSFHLRSTIRAWKRLLEYGMPSVLSQMMLPISSALVIGIIGAYGTLAVAAYTISSQIASVLMIVGLGISIVLRLFISMNFGAGNFNRVRTALRSAMQITLTWGVVCWLGLMISGDFCVGLLSNDKDLLPIARTALQTGAAGMTGRIATVMASAALTSLHKPLEGALMPLLSAFLLTVPSAFLGSKLGGLSGVFYGLMFAGLLGLPISHLWVKVRSERALR